MTKKTTTKPTADLPEVVSLVDLQIKADTDPRYAQLALIAAADDLTKWKKPAVVMKAVRALQYRALLTSAADVVAFVNSCRSMVTVADTTRTTPKRGYSKRFTPASQDTQARYLLDLIPGALWRKVSDKCKRDGVSRRAVILHLLEEWSNRS